MSTVVEDGQSVKQGDQLINYNVNDQKRQDLQDKVNAHLLYLVNLGAFDHLHYS